MSMPTPATLCRVASQILAESNSDKEESPVVAYRGLQRWTRSFERVALLPSKAESPAPDAKRTYLITGGLGTLGLVLAQHMAAKAACRLILTTRSDFPNRNDWSSLSQHHDDDAKIRRTLQALNKIEETGSEVWVRTADVAEYSAMEKLVQDVQSNWGDIYGVIHLAGITGDKALRLISDLSQRDCQFQFRPKIQGSCVLHEIFRSRPLAFCVLFSSTASLLGGPGMLAYMAASCFLDSFAANCHLQGQRWVSIDWDGWVEQNDSHFVEGHSTSLDRYALPYSEALALLDRVLASDVGGPLIISSDDVVSRVTEWTAYGKKPAGELAEVSHMRPNLGSEYVAPKLPMQKQIAGIWSEILGIDQIGIYDNLFELGGNSLIGLRIVTRLKKDLNIDIPVTALFEGPTIFTLSRLIERKGAGAAENYTASRQRGELRRNRRMNAGAVNS